MNKKIKVIDLLNMIAEGKELPKLIVYDYKKYWYDETDDNEVARYKDNEYDWLLDVCHLEDEVEIIEGQEEIDIQGIEEIDEHYTYIENHSAEVSIEKVLTKAEIELVNKINELIKAIKQLDNKINGK